MPVGMGEPEDADPTKVRSVNRGYGEFGISRLSRARVVIARYLPAAGTSRLAERYEVDEGGAELDRDALLQRVTGAAALVADPTVPVDALLLDAATPGLRVVSNFAVGYDNIDVQACAARGVVITNTPDVLTNATAELAVTLMLAAARRLGEGERMLRAGRWRGWEPGQLLGRELSGAVVGIVGLGRIGARVAELLRGFDVEILYTARAPRPGAEEQLGARRVELEDLLARADFVTLHVPLTSETHHLIDHRALERMKPGAVLVNTSRGGLVDAAALADAIADGRLAGAGLDVYEQEPQIPGELLQLERVVLAPHIGSATASARDGMARLAADNVIAVLEGRPPLTPVSPPS